MVIKGLKYRFSLSKNAEKCNVFGCRGNLKGESYTKNVKFLTDEVERNRLIDAMPNERSSLLKLKEIYACDNHFVCEWIKVRGEKNRADHHRCFQNCLSHA